MNTDNARAEAERRFIRNNLTRQPSLDQVAAHDGLGGHQVQRLLRRRAGRGPKRYLECLAVEQAGALPGQARSVLAVVCALGLNSRSGRHEQFVAAQATGPGADGRTRRGVEIRYGLAAGPFGEMLIAQTGHGICLLSFVNEQTRARELERLQRLYRRAALQEDSAAAQAAADAVFARRDTAAPTIRLAVRGSNFQISVWRALLRIPRGAVLSYSQLAMDVGRPTAVRAVANAVAANPVHYLIPCHRVVRADGSIGGYRGGSDIKRKLLDWESSAPADHPERDGAPRPRAS